MHGWTGTGMGWGMGLGMMLTWLVIALAFGAIWTWMMSGRGGWRSPDAARQILRERYARGEIDRETLQRMLTELGDQGAPSGSALWDRNRSDLHPERID